MLMKKKPRISWPHWIFVPDKHQAKAPLSSSTILNIISIKAIGLLSFGIY